MVSGTEEGEGTTYHNTLFTFTASIRLRLQVALISAVVGGIRSVGKPGFLTLYKAEKKYWYVVARNFFLFLLTFLPGPAWVLLSNFCKDFFSAL